MCALLQPAQARHVHCLVIYRHRLQAVRLCCVAPARHIAADVVLVLDQSVTGALFVAGALVVAFRRNGH